MSLRPPPIERAIQYLGSKKRKREAEYDDTYYHSPLESSDINADGNFAKKRQALESIQYVYERVLQDMGRLFESLTEANELDTDVGSKKNADDLPCDKSKVSVEASHENATPKKTPVKVKEEVKSAALKRGPKKEEEDQKPVLPATRHKTKHRVKIEEDK